MMGEIKIYWDSGNGEVATDPMGGCPIYSTENNRYIESWYVNDLEHVLNFTYSEDEKCSGLLDLHRDMHFDNHHVRPIQLRYLCVPKKRYQEEIERIKIINGL